MTKTLTAMGCVALLMIALILYGYAWSIAAFILGYVVGIVVHDKTNITHNEG